MSRPTSRLTTVGEGNGRPLPGLYRYRPDEAGRLEADAAFLADVRRRVREQREAELGYMQSVPGPVPDPEDLPAGAGDDLPVTTAPCSAVSQAVKGDSQPAGPSVRCGSCGYLTGTRGHLMTCGGEA